MSNDKKEIEYDIYKDIKFDPLLAETIKPILNPLWKNKSGKEIIKDIERAIDQMNYAVDFPIFTKKALEHEDKIANAMQRLNLTTNCIARIQGLSITLSVISHLSRLQFLKQYSFLLEFDKEAIKRLRVGVFFINQKMKQLRIVVGEELVEILNKGQNKPDVLNMYYIKKYIWPNMIRRKK